MKRFTKHIFHAKSISQRFSYAFMGVVGLLLFLFASIAIFFNITRIDTEIKDRLDNIINLSKISLSTPLWNLDSEQVGHVLDAIMLDGSVAYADILWGDRITEKKAQSKYKDKSFLFFENSPDFIAKKTQVNYEGKGVGILRIAMSRERVTREVILNSLGIVGLTVLIFAAISVTSIIITKRHIFNPLSKLKDSASLIASGELDAAIDTSTSDEIGDLANDLDGMRGSIKELIGELRDSNEKLEDYSRTLEQRVEDRTVDLTQATKEAQDARADAEEARQVIEQQKLRMENELNIAADIQLSMVPKNFEDFSNSDRISIFAAIEPAREVGGDFYDFFPIAENHVCFCIGDVSDKGVPAALLMAVTKTMVKSRAIDDPSTASIVTHVNEEISSNNANNMFVTLLIGIADTVTGEVLFTNAGHNPPFVLRKKGNVEKFSDRHGPVVGALGGIVYSEGQIMLEAGDTLYLYTDGVTEAFNSRDDLFTEKRLVEMLENISTDSPKTIVGETIEAVKAFESGTEQTDDITVVALSLADRPVGATPPNLRIVIKNNLSEISVATEKFEEFAGTHEISPNVVAKTCLAFDEILNNIITYAYLESETRAGSGPEREIRIDIEFSDTHLTVTVSDDGIPFNPLAAAAPETSLALEEREVGGLGIHLVKNMIDEVSYRRRINQNILTLIIENPAKKVEG